MKIKELRKKSDKELIQMKKDLEFDRTKASTYWGIGLVKNKDIEPPKKGLAAKGDRTSLRKNIKRTIAQINTLLNERKNNK